LNIELDSCFYLSSMFGSLVFWKLFRVYKKELLKFTTNLRTYFWIFITFLILMIFSLSIFKASLTASSYSREFIGIILDLTLIPIYIIIVTSWLFMH